MPTMPRLTVIGIGSPFADDQAGWRVIQSLSASRQIKACGERIRLVSCRSPASELLDLLTNTDAAIVVDAVRYCGAPGTLYRLRDVQSPLSATKLLSSHGVDMGTVFALASTLECSPRRLIIYGIEAGSDMTGTTLCQSVWRTAERVVQEIKRDIEDYCV
jgi:hydrogenase maturation protease